jgi:hypothetical protein
MLSFLSGGMSTLWIALGAFLIGAGTGGYTTYHWQEVALQTEIAAHQRDLKAVSDAAAVAEAEHIATEQKLQAQLAQSDAEHFKELTDAQVANDDLRASVVAGTRQLSISVATNASGGSRVPPAASTGGVGHGSTAGRAIIDRGTAEALVAIAARADRYKAQLGACQDYARAVSTKQ